MQTYARQGGTSSILICDDGMQSLAPERAQERRQYYANHGLAWVARPPHDNKEGGYKRAGRFKKGETPHLLRLDQRAHALPAASNMNYALGLSLILERHLLRLEADEGAAEYARASLRGLSLQRV